MENKEKMFKKYIQHPVQSHQIVFSFFTVPTGAPRDVRISADSPTSLLVKWTVRTGTIFYFSYYDRERIYPDAL